LPNIHQTELAHSGKVCNKDRVFTIGEGVTSWIDYTHTTDLHDIFTVNNH